MSIATFESPRTTTQQFFPWVLEEETPAAVQAVCELPLVAPKITPVVTTNRNVRSQPTTLATESRIAEPVRLGAVMIKLLKSYGISDAEIAEGMAAYAAKSGLAQAG